MTVQPASGPECVREVDLVADRVASSASVHDPFVVAIDGRGGTGKSTFADRLRTEATAAVIDTDDFHAGAEDWERLPVEDRWDRCADWHRLSAVLDELRAGRGASWYAYDWDHDDGRLSTTATLLEPCRLVVIEGTFSARPELAALVDLRVLLRTSADEQRRRFIERESLDDWSAWSNTWMAPEDLYFRDVMPEERFDLVIDL